MVVQIEVQFEQSAPKMIHPKKDKSRTKKSAFCPVVICLDKEKVSSAERFGFCQ